MSFFKNLFGGGGKNPADAAMPYLQQIPNIGHQYYDPFINQGKEAGTRLGSEYDKLLNPTDFINQIQEQYKPSEGYQYKLEQLSKGIGNTAAAGGFAGTESHQRAYGEMADQLLSQDMQQYLDNVFGRYDKGLEGEKDFYNKGYGASQSLSDMISSALGAQGQLAYEGQVSKNQQQQALVNAIMKIVGQAGGAMIGGPIGSYIGGQMAGPMSGSPGSSWKNPG